MSHTPGPWRLFSDVCPFSHDMFRIKASDGETGIAAANGPCKDATALANARLLAAAPELLEALEEVVRETETYEHTNSVHDQAFHHAVQDALNVYAGIARVAIAKARGQS